MDKQIFTPVGNRVVVKADKAETISASGIIIPETANPKKPTVGTVVAVGPGLPTKEGAVRIPCQIETGDRVLYGKWSGAEIEVEGEDYLVLPETEILLVLHGVKGDTV